MQWFAADPTVDSTQIRRIRRLAQSIQKDSTLKRKYVKSKIAPRGDKMSTDVSNIQMAKLEIERPVTPPLMVPFSNVSPLMKILAQNGWNGPQLCRVPHLSGYQAEIVASQLCSLPSSLFSAIGLVLDTIDRVKQVSEPNLLRTRMAAWQSITATDAEMGLANRLSEDDEILWEIDSETGYQVLHLHAESEMRRSMVANTALASMFGMHREELLSRLGCYDLVPPYLEIDSVLVFLYMLLQHPTPGRRTKYVRMRLAGRCALVRWSTFIITDDCGRVAEVGGACCAVYNRATVFNYLSAFFSHPLFLV